MLSLSISICLSLSNFTSCAYKDSGLVVPFKCEESIEESVGFNRYLEGLYSSCFFLVKKRRKVKTFWDPIVQNKYENVCVVKNRGKNDSFNHFNFWTTLRLNFILHGGIKSFILN